ncbi:MAG: ABC transporter substrate-binding protein [Caldilineaceae bacterium]
MWYQKRSSLPLYLFISLVLLILLLTSCTSVRPVIKIGLLAPFEGLHRRSGYEALTFMRQAIADYSTTDEVAIMPLALDDGATPVQAARAVRKMVQDGAVQAVVGPYRPVLVPSVEAALASTGLPWLMPFAVDPTSGFVFPDQTGTWALPLLTAAAEQAQALGGQRLVLAGWTPGWPHLTAEQAATAFAVPLLVSDQITVVQVEDAVLWLGAPEAAAVYLTALRAQFPTVPFLLGPQADSPILSERTQNIGSVYLLFWLDDHYEQWRTQAGVVSPTAYLTYRVTQQAIARSLGHAWLESQSWRIQAVVVSKDGIR